MRIGALSLGLALLWSSVVYAADLCPGHPEYQPIATRGYHGMAYRITDCNAHDSTIIGTLHSSDPAIIASIATVFPALKHAKSAWFELVPNVGDETLLAKRMFLPASQKEGLKQLLGEKDFASLMSYLHTKAPNLPEAYVTRYQPWAAGVMLDMLSVDTSSVVMDDLLQQQAIKNGISVHALETMEEQFSIFELLSDSEQLAMLKESIASFKEAQTINNQLLQAYISGDLHTIAQLSASTFKEMSDKKLAAKLLGALVTDRNATMAKKLIPVVKKGNAFIAVGALHLPDESGLLAAFEAAGYGIYPIAENITK